MHYSAFYILLFNMFLGETVFNCRGKCIQTLAEINSLIDGVMHRNTTMKKLFCSDSQNPQVALDQNQNNNCWFKDRRFPLCRKDVRNIREGCLLLALKSTFTTMNKNKEPCAVNNKKSIIILNLHWYGVDACNLSELY